MHQEWASVVGVAQGGGLRPYVAQAEGFVCQLYCARLVQDFQRLSSHVESAYSEGICRS